MTYRKKLIEVALPLAKINEAAAREKSIRHGHPSTLHLWWARRPLAACRAVLFASLVDDPDSDPAYRRSDGSVDEQRAGLKRAELFTLIEELVLWENSNNPRVINKARAEIARCVASRKIETGDLKKDQKLSLASPLGNGRGEGVTATPWDFMTLQAPPEAVNAFLAEHGPPVLDPFCGGGSIPLEAQRLGLRAYASDLNPVAVLITKALIEIPPKFAERPPVNSDWQRKSATEKAAKVWSSAQGLAEDVRYYGKWMRDEAEKRIGHLYPNVKITKEMAKARPDLKEYVGEELTVIAWLWARTVASPSPVYQGVQVPLVSGFWLSNKAGREAWIELVADRKNKTYHFMVRRGKPSADEKKTIEAGTKLARGCKFRCVLSDEPIPEDHVKSQGRVGKLDACLMAVVAEGTKGRVYLPPEAVEQASVRGPSDLRGINAPLANDPRNLWCLGYGLDTFDKLFTPRQLVALTTLSDLVQEARERVRRDAAKAGLPCDEHSLAEGGIGTAAYADAVATYLGLALSRLADASTSLTRWKPSMDQAIATFGRQALPMVWDYAESNVFNRNAGDYATSLGTIIRVMDRLLGVGESHVTQLDASAVDPLGISPLVCTDPPYYDNIGYADLSDFFYVWLRKALGRIYPGLFATLLTPKTQELIASPYRHEGSRTKAQRFFEDGLGKAFDRLRKAHSAEYPLTVYYAFKQSETDEDSKDHGSSNSLAIASTGWETMLEGLLRAGFTITGTWPMRTELGNRMVGSGTNALASSIILVCRPRPADASLATRKQFIAALRQELPDGLRNLQHGNIAPVDLAQAAIGPGMAVFTRYAKVMETDGSAMTVRTALGLINQSLDEVFAEQEGDFDGDTRWALAWFEQYGMSDGPFGVAEVLSKAKDTGVNGLVEAGVVTARGGKVRLVKRDELPDDWDPTHAGRLTVWEATQHLIRALDKHGESGAAALLHKLGGVAEAARDLAYRLYILCERKKWAEEALAYNGLVIAWPELSKLALAERTKSPAAQGEMF
jgi:putative DNA methylase